MSDDPAPLCHFVVPGEAAGKKNSSNIIWPSIAALRIPTRDGRPGIGNGLKDLFAELRAQIVFDRDAALEFLAKCEETVSPVIVPPRDHHNWHKRALPIAQAVPGPRPLLEHGHLARLRTVVYMGKGQTGDLNNFEQATWDLMQDAGLILNDHWINNQDGSERRWDDLGSPRVEITLWDLGPKKASVLPMVRVNGMTAAARGTGPLFFDVVAGELTMSRCQVPRGTTRDDLVAEASRLWRVRHGEPLPAGATLYVGGAPAATASLF